MTFEVTRAVRKATPALIGIWGPSGSGKTLSALRMARGLVGEQGKIVLADTENRRAEFYANEVGGWDHIDVQPPFSPERYIEAMTAAEKAGADVIIFDSASHAWAGEGGVIDMAEGVNTVGLGKWRAPKMRYQKMFNALLRSRVHVIFCLRAKHLNQQRGKGKDAEIVSLGLTPICEKNFIYEMTLAFLLGPDHKPVARNTEDFKAAPMVPSFKVPDELLSSVDPSEYLSEKTGQAIAQWIGGGAPVDHEAEQLRREAREKAMLGSIPMRDWWQSIGKEKQHALKSMLDELRNLAAEADRAEAERAREEYAEDGDGSDPLDDAFTPPERDSEAA